jgi:hypothetical protein
LDFLPLLPLSRLLVYGYLRVRADSEMGASSLISTNLGGLSWSCGTAIDFYLCFMSTIIGCFSPGVVKECLRDWLGEFDWGFATVGVGERREGEVVDLLSP